MLGFTLLVGALAGCTTPTALKVGFGPRYIPQNTYSAFPNFPGQVRRVAVLPVTIEPGDWQAERSLDMLETELRAALGKRQLFESVFVSPDLLKEWTGRSGWRAEEKLPARLFDQLKETYDCDAVLFTHLQAYHPYTPLRVGWRMNLVDLKTHVIIWAADEIFDAAEPTVARAAQWHFCQSGEAGSHGADTQAVLMSPRRFTDYTLAALMSTMPDR